MKEMSLRQDLENRSLNLNEEINIVTCPTFPEFRPSYDRLLQIFNEANIQGRTWVYPHGRMRHLWIFNTHDLLDGKLKEAYRLSNQISLKPLMFHINGNVSDRAINSYKFQILDYLKSKWKYDYDIRVYQKDNLNGQTFTLVPLIQDPEDTYSLELYFPEAEIIHHQSNVKFKINTNIPVGSDPLIEYLLRDLPERDSLDFQDGVYFLPLPVNNIIFTEDFIEGYLDQIRSLKSLGYFSIPINIDTKDTTKDLLSLLGVPIIYETEGYFFGKTPPDRDYLDPEKFVQENLERIKSDKIPIVALSGAWMLYLKIDSSIIARIYFILYRLLVKYSLLRPYLDEIHVFDDCSVKIPFLNIEFLSSVEESLIEEIDKIGRIYYLKVPDNFTGLLYRYVLNEVEGSQISLLIPVNGELYLISSIDSIKVPTMSKLESLLKKAPEGLKSMMLKFLHDECGMASDPVSLKSFEEMELQELVTVIRPEVKSSYCFSLATLSSLQRKISPVTAIPFPERIIRLINDPTLGIRGILPVGNIPGLIQVSDLNIPKIQPVESYLIRTDSPQDEISGNSDTTLVQIQFQDGRIVDLLEIDTILPEQDFEMLNKLWNQGYFLNIWGQITNEYLKHLGDSFLRFDPLLYLGKGSPGQVAESLNRLRYTALEN